MKIEMVDLIALRLAARKRLDWAAIAAWGALLIAGGLAGFVAGSLPQSVLRYVLL